MDEWHDLFVTTAGASSALTGLLFVGVSINLARILSLPQLTERALLSLIFLLTILTISIMMLVPNQSLVTLGIELSVITLCCIIFTLVIDITVLKKSEKEYKQKRVITSMVDAVAVLPYIVAVIYLLSNYETGLYWIAVSFLFGFIKAVSDAWVLLIEINR